MINRNIDGYEITQEVGRGNAAAVYAARQQPVGRYVAIKIFDHLTSDSAARLEQLFTQLEAIDHVNILPMYDSGQIDDRVYWVMRYMPTGPLKTRSHWTIDQIDQLIGQVASALDYAHQHDLVHGSLKPSNVLLDHAGNAFVCDFGVAHIVGQSPSDYPLPEQRRDFKPDVRSDVYALGALAYELLTGRPPIDLRGREQDRLNWRVTLPPLPSSINSKLSPAIDAAVMKALSIDPAQRYPSAPEFAEAFTQVRGTVEAVQDETQPLDRVSDSTARRVRTAHAKIDWRWIAGGFIGLLILIGLSSVLSSPPQATVIQSTSTPVSIVTAVSTSIPLAVPRPSSVPTSEPSVTPGSIVSATPIISVPSTSAPTPKPPLAPTVPVRASVTPTPTVPISIESLTLLIPRKADRATLRLHFHTHIRPDNAGPIGMLSMSIPAIEPLIKERGLAAVGSGDQTLGVSIVLSCNLLADPITTRQILLIVKDAQGKTIYAQSLDYTKTWCQ
ncbi:MAG TPA: protein kinase [Anaerolineae bacterium]|nr:protein kinase [Anaerolineae bacterium]